MVMVLVHFSDWAHEQLDNMEPLTSKGNKEKENTKSARKRGVHQVKVTKNQEQAKIALRAGNSMDSIPASCHYVPPGWQPEDGSWLRDFAS